MRQISAVSCLLVLVMSAFGTEPEMVRPETLPQGFVLIVKDESGQANQDNPIYLASSINGWNPSDESSVLSGRSDTRWQIVIDRDLHGVGLEFKFTLGGWDREEYDGSGSPIGNRVLPLVDVSALRENERPVIELTIPEFRLPVELSDEVRQRGIYRALDVTGTVKRIEVRGGAGGAETMTRDLIVWLPEGYGDEANADRQYPVMYMFDGQNLFDQMPGVPGEWGVDETLTELIGEGRVEPMIVVGIPHAGEYRMREFMPMGSYQAIDGDGVAGMAWVVEEVVPKINRAFRVREGRESTAIGGASLGGAMALYGATAHSDIFGMALIESLPMIGQVETLQHIEKSDGFPVKYVMGMGTAEVGSDPADAERNQQYVDWASAADEVLSGWGKISDENHLLILGEGQVHNESAWAARFGQAIEFLFPAE